MSDAATADAREPRRPVRIANASGFYGDRLTALHEQVTGGDVDVVTGDYLAELTMLILGRDRLKDPTLGYARTFLRQLDDALGEALDRDVRIVVNAGGLNPAGLADAVRELADGLGLDPAVAHVEGDDVRELAGKLGHPDALTANAYLGGFGITRALAAGADVVVTGRVTDAALVIGSAAWWHDWSADDLDPLAGALVAGHVIECGCQATGGNLAGVDLDRVVRPGFPIAELAADGSCLITKHEGTGGLVDVDTVTAQLLYEVAGPRYMNPDVTLRLDSLRVAQDGPDRVAVTGARGEAPPTHLKVAVNVLGGHRNEVEFLLTGLDIEAKAELVRRQVTDALADDPPAEVTWTLARTDRPDAATQERASARLRCAVKDPDPDRIGRRFSSACVELALASYPGFAVTAPPSKATPYGVYHPAFVAADEVDHVVVLPDGSREEIAPATGGADHPPPIPPRQRADPFAGGPTRRVPLGLVARARSGDKGGDANVGVWVATDEAYAWLASLLDADAVRALLPEAALLDVEVHPLPNLRAVNVVVHGLLGEGVSSSTRFDPQAKGLGEWLRSRHVEVPVALLDDPAVRVPSS